jgi:predicted nucleic acid-binding protein
VSGVLVDSSVWIDFFRGNAAAASRMAPLRESGWVAITGPIYAEVTSAAPHRAAIDRLAGLFRGLTWLEPPGRAWEQVAEARFALARQGVQAHVVDLLIAVTALGAGHAVLTCDRDFAAIARVLAVECEIF